MDKIDTVIKTIIISIVVANFLKNTGRASKAVDLLKECLVLLNSEALSEDLQQAESHFSGIRHVFRSIQYRFEILLAESYRSVGLQCYNRGELFATKELFEKALAIDIKIDNKTGEATDYGCLGTVFNCVGQYIKAKKYHKKALAIRMEIGDRSGEASSYGNLGSVFCIFGEYVKAKEYHEKALAIDIKLGDRKEEAAHYGNLGSVFQALGEFVKVKEYHEKALAIRKEIGDRHGEASSYERLGTVLYFLGEKAKDQEYNEKALAIRIEIGDKNGEASSYINLAAVVCSRGEYDKAKEYHEKALEITKESGDKKAEASCYLSLGYLFEILSKYDLAEKHVKMALSISKDIGHNEKELHCHVALTRVKLSQGDIQEAFTNLFQCIKKCEDLRNSLAGNDYFKISFSDVNALPYKMLSELFCAAENPNEALYVVELCRARALADLMIAQHSVKMSFSANTESWVGMENIMKKESNCTCLYISYNDREVFFWILKTSGVIHPRKITVNEDTVKNLGHFFCKSFRSFGILPEEKCEDRSLNDTQPNSKSSQEQIPAGSRLVEDGDEESREAEPSLTLFYKMLIAPVADLLQDQEIIIVPDRSLYQVPFAALLDESEKYLSETFRIRIVPSLTTLKLIQDSPADYYSQTGALIVSDPKVGQVVYKGRLKGLSRLPCAGKEAEMIGRLLGVQPLLGEHATKQAVLQRIGLVSLIHFAAHGNAERGEIALAPQVTSHRIPEEGEYLLTMSDISKVQLRAKLVVLSCCHSGNGQIRTEGVVGIARAFLGSGARSVLVALWAIEDTATEQQSSESASECLHEAMMWMRANGYSDVRQWAPFMLIGDNVTFDFGK